MNNNSQQFAKLVNRPLQFRLFLFLKLPAAFFSGIRVKKFTAQQAIVTVPYKWFTKNPFRSTYFACMAMAAEMSTGLLCMLHTYKSKPAVSMLVTGLEATYHKKATGSTSFTCNNGQQIQSVIEDAVKTKEARTFRAASTGLNENGELIAEFFITWSFKVKS
jgi:hypothetical protein